MYRLVYFKKKHKNLSEFKLEKEIIYSLETSNRDLAYKYYNRLVEEELEKPYIEDGILYTYSATLYYKGKYNTIEDSYYLSKEKELLTKYELDLTIVTEGYNIIFNFSYEGLNLFSVKNEIAEFKFYKLDGLISITLCNSPFKINKEKVNLITKDYTNKIKKDWLTNQEFYNFVFKDQYFTDTDCEALLENLFNLELSVLETKENYITDGLPVKIEFVVDEDSLMCKEIKVLNK